MLYISVLKERLALTDNTLFCAVGFPDVTSSSKYGRSQQHG
jgi:hypothetical protein